MEGRAHTRLRRSVRCNPEIGSTKSKVRLNSGDRLLLYTDGITECRNAAGDEFGAEVLTNVVGGFNSVEPDRNRRSRSRRSVFSNGNFEDDLTVISIVVD